MIKRLRAAWRALFGGVADPSETCARCVNLRERLDLALEDRDYWKRREERTADALHAKEGVLSLVASPPAKKQESMQALIARGMAVTEIDSTKSNSRAGDGPGGAREH